MIIKKGLAAPEFELVMNIVEAVFSINFVVNSEAAIFVADSFLIFGVDEDLKDID